MKETKQKGAALIIFAVIFALAATAFLISQLDASGVKIERDKKTALALAEAKSALIGSVVSINNIAVPGYLPNPDLKLGASVEGRQALSFGAVDISLIGKFPWRDLGVSPLRDGWNECLWYIVSGRFKNSPSTAEFNWDTLGQITVIDGAGNIIASNLVALIISPGALLSGQDRQLGATDTPQCGGNYDVRNYLDSHSSLNAVAGEVNYFAGSALNRQAPNTDVKKFVLAKNDFYNDQFSFVTADEVFRPLIRRSDFSVQITALLEDAYFQTVAITGNKGTGSVVCNLLLPANQTFCKNWKEMLLITDLPMPAPIFIDEVQTSDCKRVLIFGGQKTDAQVRDTLVNKDNAANYLEDVNLVSFNTHSNGFNGSSSFKASNSSADILRCL